MSTKIAHGQWVTVQRTPTSPQLAGQVMNSNNGYYLVRLKETRKCINVRRSSILCILSAMDTRKTEAAWRETHNNERDDEHSEEEDAVMDDADIAQQRHEDEHVIASLTLLGLRERILWR